MSGYVEFRNKLLENPEVKAQYEAMKPEYDIIQTLNVRKRQKGLTHKNLKKEYKINENNDNKTRTR